MRNLAVLVLVLAMVGLNTAYWMGGILDLDADEAAALESDAKRAGRDLSSSKDLCIPWRAPCPSDSSLSRQYSFLRCCGGLACKCTFWGNNCKCESRFGR